MPISFPGTKRQQEDADSIGTVAPKVELDGSSTTSATQGTLTVGILSATQQASKVSGKTDDFP